eukprot:TRINITY_DN3333_c0_g1_i1.p1 TRINITY_DN3333_c0_g1~~TRINITY_DN3333_c0_g1_i1.p1  ORF type:complete len:804 (+),score=151.38 TRINITY_DN3333_c0_g1_i1:249-2414(+)
MSHYVEVLTTDTEETVSSILLSIEQHSFLINCGEGTQRFFVEGKAKLKKLTHIFFTSIQWEYFGGIPGALLTMADGGGEALKLLGGKNLPQLIESTRYFVSRNNFDMLVKEFQEDDYYIDSKTGLSVVPIVLSKVGYNRDPVVEPDTPEKMISAKSIVEYKPDVGMYNMKLCFTSRKRDRDGQVVEHGDVRRRCLPRTQPNDYVLSYVFQPPTIRGKFNSKRAIELGVKPGLAFGKLSRGETVITEDGRVVTPEEVISPSDPVPVIIVIHCPDLEYMNLLLQNEKLMEYFQPNQERFTHIIYHMTPSDILSNPRYISWCLSFGADVQHVALNKDMCDKRIMFKSFYKNQIRLNSLCPEIYLEPYYSFDRMDLPVEVPFIYGEPRLQNCLYPASRRGISTELVPDTNYSVFLEDENLEIVKQALTENKFYEIQPNTTEDEPSFLFLGTASSQPGKYRNVSGNLLVVPGHGNILFDCGEGSYGQIFRAYGEKTREIISDIKAVFISHLHADHHLGLIRILMKHKEFITASGNDFNPITIMAPNVFLPWLEELSEILDISYTFIDAEESLDKDIFVTDSLSFHTAYVIHCPHSFGVSCVYHGENPWKIVYSGDTRPSEALEELGMNATLLIHEATFEDEMQESAVEKQHSTTSEATTSAQKMDVGFLMLFHFSQRYPHIPPLPEHYKTVGIAFDLMQIKFSDFPRLPLLSTPISTLFDEQEDEE